MTPNELEILRIIKELGKASKRDVALRMGITDEYGGYLMKCVKRMGYVEKVSLKSYTPGFPKYEITVKGLEALKVQLELLKAKQVLKATVALQSIKRADKKIKELTRKIEKRAASQ